MPKKIGMREAFMITFYELIINKVFAGLRRLSLTRSPKYVDLDACCITSTYFAGQKPEIENLATNYLKSAVM